MDPIFAQAADLANRSVFRAISTFGKLQSFNEVAEEGKRLAAATIEAKRRQLIKQYLNDPEKEDMWLRKPELNSEEFERLISLGVSSTLGQAEQAVRDAIVVFAHSALDELIMQLIRVVALLSPEDWSTFLSNRKIPLSEIKGSSYEEHLKLELEGHLKQLERESLPKKVRIFLEKCPIPKEWMENAEAFQFDINAVVELDNDRINVIHISGESSMKVPYLSFNYYLIQLTFFFFGLLNHRFDIKLNPSYLLTVAPTESSGPLESAG